PTDPTASFIDQHLLKSHCGTVSDEQEDFLDDAAAAGWLTAVVRSSDEFVKVVEQWIRDRP
ncbi:hypothetical protein, partial [Variovorax sp. WDL1]|uniref:hypothetical protein n=1 Tax=Variovorax sp. WDL1 TaxID=207745 RepID=UPI003FCCDB3C